MSLYSHGLMAFETLIDLVYYKCISDEPLGSHCISKTREKGNRKNCLAGPQPGWAGF